MYATLEQLKNALNLSDTSQDTYLNDLLNYVTQMIDTYTGRTWQGPQEVENEEYDLPQNSDGVFFLRKTDIVSFQELQVGTPFNPTSYQVLSVGTDFVWNSFGRVIIPNFSAGWEITMFGGNQFNLGPITTYGAFLASYTWGQSSPPFDITGACERIASYMYTNRAGMRLRQERIGDYARDFDMASRTQVESIIQECGVQDTLGSYKLKHI